MERIFKIYISSPQPSGLRQLAMSTFSALKIFVVTLALICLALVPVAIGRDPGQTARIAEMDALPVARWPNLLTRVGIACLLVSFALMLAACYTILGDMHD
jgi:hypothetical protein